MSQSLTPLPQNPDMTFNNPSNGLLSVVTGGSGFIGRHLVGLLLDRGQQVRVIDVQVPGHLDERVEYFNGSILDQKLLRTVMEGADQVFHLAANPNMWALDKQEFYQLNFMGTRAVLQAAGRAGVKRIVHTSTESILKGHKRANGDAVNETVKRTVDDMPGPYCRSKFWQRRKP